MIISNLKQFFAKNKKIPYYLLFFLTVFLLSSDVTFAEFKANDIAKGFSEVLKVIAVFLGLMTYLTTMFLSPEWINGSLFGMTAKFKDVWILVSNVVYFVFAFILIWIAFMNIIGKTGDNYQLKQALPKFIVGVLIVPFSWFLVQFILSISAILTISALSLPGDAFPDYKSKLGEIKIPNSCTIDLTSFSGTDSTDKTKSTSFIKCPHEKENETVFLSTLLNGGDSTSSIYGLISTYTYGIISFDTIGSVTKFSAQSIHNIGDLVIKIVFDVLFVLVYAILMITLGIVLMIRGIYIWIYIMLSPIFGLMYFFGKAEGGEGFFAKFNVKEFIALAMVPVYTMLALSFGLLFMYVIGSGLVVDNGTNKTSSVGGNTVKVENNKDNKSSSIIIGKDAKTGFELKFVGALSQDKDSANDFLSIVGGGALGVVGALILKLFGIVVLWGTLLAAMRTSEITKTITEPIYNFGKQVGQIASSAPGNIPVFGGVSAKGMEQFGNDYSSHINQKSVKTGQFLNKKFGIDTESAGAKANLGQKLSQKVKDRDTVIKMREAMESMKTVEAMKNDSQFIGYVKQMAEIFGEKLENIDLKTTNGMTEALNRIDKQIDTNYKGFNTSLFNKNNSGVNVTGTEKSTKEINDDLKSKINIDTPETKNNEINIKIEERFFDDTGLKLKSGAIDNVSQTIYNKVGPNKFTEEEFKKILAENLEEQDINNIIGHIKEKILPKGVKLFKDNEE